MLFEELAFDGTWRPYQRAALAAFDRDRRAGRRRTHIVAPPASGKTLLGVELVRMTGRRALVLAPTGTLQMQWPRAARRFGAPTGTVGPEAAFPIACLSYGTLCGIDDPEIALERAGVTGAGRDAIARGDHSRIDLAELLSAEAHDRVERLRAARPGIVVLDECHHLASAWGYVVSAVLAEVLGEDVHVVGLTSTPPADLSDRALYDRLVGPVDFTVPTPAVVRDGHLAPYLELAWFTEPVEPERAWLGTHPGSPEAGRLLVGSRSKALGMVEVVALESAAREAALRALVLCDSEHGERPDRHLEGVLDPAAGSARGALVALGADPRTAPLRPLLVSGRGLRCLPADAEALLPALVEEAERDLALPEWSAEPDGVLVSLRSHGAEWVPRAWVELATRVFERGVSGALVGTRGLLGESWDCPAINCLVDLTTSAAGASVQQVRGRSLRPDPRDPAKLATNWDVVCVVPGGGADHDRFVARHAGLYAPADDGMLEAGPSHVHVDLAAGPPLDAAARRDGGVELGSLDRAIAARAAARDEARERWRIGEPYRSEVVATLVVRAGEAAPHEPPGGGPALPIALGLALAAAAVVAAILTGAAALLAGLLLAPAGLGVAAARLRRMRDRLPRELPLDGAARAVAGAYGDLGELAPGASPVIASRAPGHLRIRLEDATPEESHAFVAALLELVGSAPPAGPTVTRALPDPDAGAMTLLRRVLTRRPPFALARHAVPRDLAREPERAEAFAGAWRRHVGPTRLEPGGTPDDGGYAAVRLDAWV